ncbi:interferon regulatory factor 1b [Paramormyrops kingsleyae]|uniref:Interferon regulatory factor n=1 Tax=Paramormyrops kingsleyae TaxID=1676925 RepID=A0A3B3RK87_9TELE|nr:interferon regulatory factor 1-like [Paramormyrops kingsleyae]
MPVQRMKMRPWLEKKIEHQEIQGLRWVDTEKKIFSIPWKHAARHGWEMDKDASLFMQWAIHTGKYKPGVTHPDPKTWKANFRCAMNSLPDIEEVKAKSVHKGSDAVRVYRMLQSVTKKKEKKSRTKDNRRKMKVVESDTKMDDVDHKQSKTETTVQDEPMQETTVDSSENQVSSSHQYGNEEDFSNWPPAVTTTVSEVDSTNVFHFQVSPLPSSGFEDDEAVLIDLAYEQEQWQQSSIDGKGFLSNDMGAADSSHSQDSLYSGAENELYYSELHSETSGAIRDYETSNGMNFYPSQPICCPH